MSRSIHRFGEKLRTLRQRRGMTMQSLTDALGTSSGYISNVEHGKVRPNIDFAMQVAQFFGVTADQLMRDDLELDPLYEQQS